MLRLPVPTRPMPLHTRRHPRRVLRGGRRSNETVYFYPHDIRTILPVVVEEEEVDMVVMVIAIMMTTRRRRGCRLLVNASHNTDEEVEERLLLAR